MNLALILATAQTNATGTAGVLTLLFPLVLVFIVAALWWFSLRRSRGQ